MNKRYIIGIVIAAFTLFANQIFIQYWLSKMKFDANTINLAGRQRLLSKQVSLEFYKLTYEEKNFEAIRPIFERWENTHQELLIGEAHKNFAPINNPEARTLMLELSPSIAFVREKITNEEIPTRETLKRITDKQLSYLSSMDKVVKILEKASEKKLRFIVWTEIFLMLISITILILEVFYIYMPIEHKLREFLEIKRKNRELEQFTYIASHDLQEPLRTVTSFAGYLDKNYNQHFDETGKQSMAFIHEATNRMSQLIKGLLDYSRIGRDRKITTIDTEKMLQAIIEDLSLKIKETNTHIDVAKLPRINGFETELRLLFQNLISNAIKFRKMDTDPNIFITALPEKDHWKFSIRDNGIGISEENSDKIFNIFQRLHSREKYEGTGIGLAHCRKIVELHGGEIWVESTPGEGSIFHFTLKPTDEE